MPSHFYLSSLSFLYAKRSERLMEMEVKVHARGSAIAAAAAAVAARRLYAALRVSHFCIRFICAAGIFKTSWKRDYYSPPISIRLSSVYKHVRPMRVFPLFILYTALLAYTYCILR